MKPKKNDRRQIGGIACPMPTSVGSSEANAGNVDAFSEAVQAAEARYRALFANMQNGVVILRVVGDCEDFILVDMNRAAERIERISRAEAIGRSVLEVLPGLQEFGLLDVLMTVWRTGEPIDHPVTKYKDDRLEGWRDHFVYRLPSGELVSVYSDETKRKRAEEEMRRSQERFSAVVQSVTDCIFIKDGSLRYTYVNPAMESLLGRTSSEIVGRTADEIYGEEAGQTLREWDRRVLEGESIEGEHTRPVNGANLTFHDIIVPLRNDDGEVVGVCGITRDITERKKMSWGMSSGSVEYRSRAMMEAMNKAFFASTTDSIILLFGESGSGKDHLARWIHDHSRRADGPFFAVNCAAIAPELAESELFGHEQGAFTGARGKKKGLLELAEGGTLLLNEIGELSLSMQAKLLTFLDTRSFLRVGGEKSVYVNARLIAATHRDLEQEVRDGRFLQALYYRLSVFPIRVPPLRELIQDIAVISESLLKWLVREMQISEPPVLQETDIDVLAGYNWPGNIRELRNVLERSLMVTGGGAFRIVLSPSDSGARDWYLNLRFPTEGTLRDVNAQVTETLCAEALRRCGGNRKEAARLLGISRDSIHRYIRRYGLCCKHQTRS
jgi:PAS domain S-box-containing protein